MVSFGWGRNAYVGRDNASPFAGQPNLPGSTLTVDGVPLVGKGWTRERAVEYLLAHTVEQREFVEVEVDRYIGDPGQATGYMIGMLEIRRLRDLAQAKLGPRFQLKEFHDHVLEDGMVTLPMLRAKIERWIAEAR